MGECGVVECCVKSVGFVFNVYQELGESLQLEVRGSSFKNVVEDVDHLVEPRKLPCQGAAGYAGWE